MVLLLRNFLERVGLFPLEAVETSDRVSFPLHLEALTKSSSSRDVGFLPQARNTIRGHDS